MTSNNSYLLFWSLMFLSFAISAMIVSFAYAYTYTTQYASQCNTTATQVGTTQIGSGLDCLAYCTSVNATCCSQRDSYDIEGSYISTRCIARNTTSVTAISNTATYEYSAYVISYAVAQPDLSAGTVSPTTATVGTAVTLSSTISNSGSVSSGAGFTNLFQRATDASGTSATDIGTHTASALASGGSTNATLSYAFPSAATWYVRACADKSSSASTGSITESNESNNCGSWTAVSVTSNSTYSSTLYNQSWCTGATTLGTQTQYTNSCLTYCLALGATCCTTNTINSDLNGDSWICTAKTPNTYGSKSNEQSTTWQGGEPYTTIRSWTARVIEYNATQISASLVANPTTVTTQNPQSLLTWSSTGATTCTGSGTGFDTGGATSGSDYVSPTTQTTYTVTCTSAGGQQASQSVSVSSNQFQVSCTASTGTGAGYGYIGTPVTWTVSPLYGPSGSYTYSWSGSDSLSGTGSSVEKTYTSTGQKTATVTVTSGGYTIATQCLYSGCTESTCSSDGIVIVEAGGSDMSAGTPSLASGALNAGSDITFSAPVVNIGGESIDAYFQNKFQIDIDNDGTYDTELQVLGNISTYKVWHGDLMCSGGTLINSGNDVQDTGNLSNPSGLARSNCSSEGAFVPNTCCNTSYRHESCSPPTICYYYFDWQVYSSDTAIDMVYGQCSGGTKVKTMHLYEDTTGGQSGEGSFLESICLENGSPGQCCDTKVTYEYGQPHVNYRIEWYEGATYSSTVTGESCNPGDICDYSAGIISGGNPWTLVPETGCGSSSNCQAGTWESVAGVHYVIPIGDSASVTSPSWTNIPPGTHAVRFCSDLPSEAIDETNENNNCGEDFVFTVSGIDFTASAPNLDSGTLTAGQLVTFYATVSNVGTVNHTGTIPNRFQIDLQDNGSWNTDLDSSVTDLSAGESKQPVSPSWTAVEGTHAIRMCADIPDAIAESDETNNCGSSLIFTVSAPTQCADGIDNNGNGLIDLADTFACTSGGDTTEEGLPIGVISVILSPSSGLEGKDIVRINTPAVLDWSATDVVAGSCVLTGSNGDSFALSGSSGSVTSSNLKSETTFTLSCTDQNEEVISVSRIIRVTPSFEDL